MLLKNQKTGRSWSIFLAALLGVIVCFLSTASGLFRKFKEDNLRELFSDYDITHPIVVTAGGTFISHDVGNAEVLTEEHHAKRRNRKKRSLDDTDIIEVSFIGGNDLDQFNHSIDVRNDMHRDASNYDIAVANFTSVLPPPLRSHAIWTRHMRRKYLHFNVSAFGRNLQLRVENKRTLIAPGAKSILFTSDGRKIEKDLSTSCMYFGKIPHHPASKVAISNCNGLAGYIQTNEEELYIEPIEEKQRTELPQRHVIYRRSSRSQNIEKRMDKAEDVVKNHDYVPISESVDLLLQKEQLKTLPLKRKQNLCCERATSFLATHRTKRHSKRNDYNIEVLLTADSSVVRFHGRDNVENYLLTLMNIVDEIYHDSSLGEHVNIILSRLYQLDEFRSRSLLRRDNPAVSLKNVCRWAHRMYRSDPSPSGKSPDHSIFLTKKNFGPAGYAHVAGMCQPLRSCSLNLEDGFSSAFVIAHETGHVLGMEHDGEGNRCGDETSMGSIMAPLVQAAFHRYHWSRCSQQELRRNLPAFNCLLDDPHSPDWGPIPIYPGVTYSMDDQCRFDFGQGYKRCTAFRNMDVCRTLWCSHDDNPLFCKTKKGPPVDGTKCGENMWCFKSHCIWRNQRQRPVNGNWGAWSSYSDCSRTCGTGVMYRSRRCDNPMPAQGGSECVGQSVGYDLCGKRPCPKGRDFRADQCMYRNNEVEFKNQRHKWLPYEPLAADLKCDLYCVSKKTNDVVTMGDYVADGTRCSYDDPHSICIRGECVEIGCDRVLGSDLKEDDCGVCNGDGSKCRNISSKVTKRINRKINAYIKLLKIPRGSRHIRIKETQGSGNGNLLALKSRVDKQYLLNGKSKQVPEAETPHRNIGAGTLWTYESTRQIETITSRGPINTDVMLMVLVKQRNVRLSVSYTYVRHLNDMSKPRDIYRFEIRRWTSCSATCGSGTRRAKYACRNVKKRKWVSRKKCRSKASRTARRGSSTQPCTVECRTPASWVSSEWSSCSTSCGSDGWQQREVNCQKADSRGQTETVNDRLCMAEEKPSTRRICHNEECPPQWGSGPWSSCSTTCGEGKQRRQVRCRAVGRTADASECSGEKPEDEQRCQVISCASDDIFRANTTRSRTTNIQIPTVRTGNCSKEPVFCRAMSQYCNKLDRLRFLCCQSCRNASIFPDVGQPSFRKQIASQTIDGFRINVTIATLVNSSATQTTKRNHRISTTPSPKNLLKNTKLRRKANQVGRRSHSRRKRSFLDSIDNSYRGKKPFSRLYHFLIDLCDSRLGTNPKSCRAIAHRKVFLRSENTPYIGYIFKEQTL